MRQSAINNYSSYFFSFHKDFKKRFCIQQRIRIDAIVIRDLDYRIRSLFRLLITIVRKQLGISETPWANSMDAIASDSDKSQADSSLRKRFEANLSNCFWRQYRLQNFAELLKTFFAIFPLFQTLPSSSHFLFNSTHLQLHHRLFLFWDIEPTCTCMSETEACPSTISLDNPSLFEVF